MPSDEVVYLRVKIETADVSEHVWRVDVEDIDCGCDKVTLVMDDPGSSSSDAVQEGERVEVAMGWETENAKIFEGVVRRTRAVAGATQRLEVVAFDLSSRLTGPRPGEASPPPLARQYVGTLEEILGQILRPHEIPIGAVTIDPMPSWSEDDPLRQQGRNDWQLIQDLAREHRARAFVEVNVQEDDSPEVREAGGTSRFYFASEQSLLEQEPMGRLHYCRGYGHLLEFDASRIASGASPSTSTTVTDPESGEAVARAGAEPATGPTPAVTPGRSSEIETNLGAGRAESYEGGVQLAADAAVQPGDVRARSTAAGLPSSPALAERLIEQDRTRVLGLFGRGLAMGTVVLRAKGAVEIEGLASWAAGRWYVHKVNHVVERQRLAGAANLTYRTRFEATR